MYAVKIYFFIFFLFEIFTVYKIVDYPGGQFIYLAVNK